VFSLSALIGTFLLNKVSDSNVFPSNSTSQQIIGFLLIGLSIITILTAFYSPSQPAFFGISLVILIILIIFSSMLGNVYFQFASNSQLASYSNSFPTAYYIFEHLPFISLIIGIILAVVMYGKTNSNSQMAY
jgi:uncharacterized membrane protein